MLRLREVQRNDRVLLQETLRGANHLFQGRVSVELGLVGQWERSFERREQYTRRCCGPEHIADDAAGR